MLARRRSASYMASLAVQSILALDSKTRISPMVLMETSQINVVVKDEENKQNDCKNGGELREYPTPIFVSEVLQYEKPSFFVCNSDNLYQDQDIPCMDSEDELDAGQIYFILPKSMLALRLSASDRSLSSREEKKQAELLYEWRLYDCEFKSIKDRCQDKESEIGLIDPLVFFKLLPSFELGMIDNFLLHPELLDVSIERTSLWPRDNIEFAFCDAVGANADKEILWASLDALISSSDVIWVGFGDFSVVRSREERMGCGCLLVQRPYCSQQPH
ncbi:nucleotide-binding alpha-beta plait domain-containing protein [Tanacetum coccineum]